MANQSQNPGSDKPADAATGGTKPHAAGSGSSTADPGNTRGQQPRAGKNGQASPPQTPDADDQIDLDSQDSPKGH
jgi:hypothetical protein